MGVALNKKRHKLSKFLFHKPVTKLARFIKYKKNEPSSFILKPGASVIKLFCR